MSMNAARPCVRSSHGLVAVTALGVLALFTATARAQAFSEARSSAIDYTRADLLPASGCPELQAFKGKDITALQATAVPESATAPAHCRVTGNIRPEIAFEVSLPAKWNGRFYMIGNGGHAGESLEDAGRVAQRNDALKLGFAFAQTNTGHDSRREPGGTFVLSSPQKAIDYAHRAVHVTAATAKDIVRKHYARAPSYSYWNSCSNGGRQGLIEAQRYPKDFDGVLANAPWVDQTGFMMGAIWNQNALAALGSEPLTPKKLALLGERVMARCDAVDGLQDGVIDDPRQCRFDARQDVPACPTGTNRDDCLTPAQADAVMKIYGGPVSKGKPLFPGFAFGSEAVVTNAAGTAASAWSGMIVPAQPGTKPAVFNLGENTMRYLVLKPPQPEYDTAQFDFDRDVRLVKDWAGKANATSTNLDAFRRRGGKLLMTYGWADQILQPMMGVNYYESLMKRYGNRTDGFARLFMVPGMTHCQGGYGTDRFDAMTALINWVERDTPPASLPASRVVGDKVVRTRPLCPYPQVARFRGMGNVDELASFRCAAP
jgi:feruloyl esterase